MRAHRIIAAGALALALGTVTASAFDGAFTDSVAQSGLTEVRACSGPAGDAQISCVAGALERTGQRLAARRDYITAATAFLDASNRVRSAASSGGSVKDKVRATRAALDDVRKALMSSSGAEKTEYSKLNRVPETAKGVLKA